MNVNELMDYDLTHDHSGNGFAIVEDIDEDYCRVTSTCLGVSKKISDAFLAWKKKLHVTMRSPSKDEPPEPVLLNKPRMGVEEFLTQLEEVRKGFKDGTLKTRDTHIVKVVQPYAHKYKKLK